MVAVLGFVWSVFAKDRVMARFDVSVRRGSRVIDCPACPPCPTSLPAKSSSCSCGGKCSKCSGACDTAAGLGALAGAGFAVGGPVGALVGFFLGGGASSAICEGLQDKH